MSNRIFDPTPAEYETRRLDYTESVSGNRPLPSVKRILITIAALLALLGAAAAMMMWLA